MPAGAHGRASASTAGTRALPRRWACLLAVALATSVGILAGCSPSTYLLPSSARVLAPTPPVGWTSGGASVRLEAADGMRFLAPVRVAFDGIAAEVTPVGADGGAIVAVTPPHSSGAVDVRVVVATGSPYERRFTLPDAYTYVPSAAVESIEPSYAGDDGGSVVRVTGSGFQRDILARVDGEPAVVERVSAAQLAVTMPAHAPGSAELTLTNMPGSAVEDTVSAGAVTYLPRDYRYHLMIATRLVDAATATVLDARLLAADRRVDSPVDIGEEQLVGSLVGEFVAALPLQAIDRDHDALWVAGVPGEDRAGARRLVMRALTNTLKGRGFATELRGFPTAENAPMSPTAFYQNDALASATPAGVVKLLTARVIVAEVIDYRARRVQPDRPPTPSEDWIASLPGRFAQISELAALTPSPVNTVMVMRSPVGRAAVPDMPWDYVTEDALVGGLSARAQVIDKAGGPHVRPAWSMGGVLGLPDGLAYTSWSEFRLANAQAEALLIYRPDESGYYGRLVDTSTGLVLSSARALPARDIFSGTAQETAYDRSESLLEVQPWYSWIPEGARVAVVTEPAASAADAAWARDARLAQDGLLSALTRAGVAVMEPMTVLYSDTDSGDGRTRHAAGAHVADPWIELRLAGATHVLVGAVDAGLDTGVMAWRFRLLSATDGSVVGEFEASEE